MKFTIANALTIIDKYKVENAKKMGMTFNNLCNSCTNVEAIPKDQYEARLKADMVDMLKELQYELYHALCHEIHGKKDCPCTNQTTSCLATFRVCDANRAIGRTIQQRINELKAESEVDEGI